MQVLHTCNFKKPNIVKAICQLRRVFIFWHIMSCLFIVLFLFCFFNLYMLYLLLCKCRCLDKRKRSDHLLYVTVWEGKWDKNKVY